MYSEKPCCNLQQSLIREFQKQIELSSEMRQFMLYEQFHSYLLITAKKQPFYQYFRVCQVGPFERDTRYVVLIKGSNEVALISYFSTFGEKFCAEQICMALQRGNQILTFLNVYLCRK